MTGTKPVIESTHHSSMTVPTGDDSHLVVDVERTVCGPPLDQLWTQCLVRGVVRPI
ncbi:hypothetical protein PGT21_008698 [Puccinia graminis f. sp. tritici]|uniref:Uncharacterized protein n=1 Tax=Puccinia graminis f. sp. tritici TaxID=56615 RepID=A0A5B0S9M3_PUCGR|nr:hypothetical protein PGT21_008698 [Puccinia graminis f. sp. tritici]KAA1134145.1 hypothetical protein PGTUg99_029729 [Puccinia graminis f. sp. tritici]